MNSHAQTPALLCLVPPGAADTVANAALAAGLDIVHAGTVAELFGHLRARAWTGTVLSLSADQVDDELADRVGREGNSGALILSARSVTLERAVAMERIGALALLREPLDEDDLRSRLGGIADEGAEIRIPRFDEAPTADVGSRPELVGQSPEIVQVIEQVARVARANTTVLVTGESGTGKEVIARALHWASDRREGPFVAVNCAAIPEQLLESELFGHERGAFTGAVARRTGRFERASGGTLFLDEIGDMSVILQAKVLRVLEERTVEPVGGNDGRPVDVRVVAATNQDLGTAIDQGRFREDLYYRLAVVELDLPPLRRRGRDVRALALHFASHFAHRHGRPVRAITRTAIKRLEAAHWPGNVRELRNVMDRAVLLANGEVIRAADLRVGAAAPRTSALGGASQRSGYDATLSLEEVESDHIGRVLQAVDGHIGRAAATLGIHRNTLARKIREYGLEMSTAS